MNIEERVQPENCAIIVVDVQNDFCHIDGSCSKRGNDIAGVIEMMPRLKSLLDEARNKGISIVFIRTTHDELTDSSAWKSRYGVAKPRPATELSCYTDSWGAEFYEIAPQKNELVVTKHRYSGFVGTNLDLLLKSLNKTSLLFTGVATNVCVENTLRDGLSHDYFVTLVEDCCATYNREDHDATVRNVKKQFGIVTTGSEVIQLWNAVESVKAGA